MNAMIDSLPTTDCTLFIKVVNEDKILKVLRTNVSEIMKNSLQICDVKSLNLILSNVSQGVTNATHITQGTNAQGSNTPLGTVNDDRRNGGKKIFDERLVKKTSR